MFDRERTVLAPLNPVLENIHRRVKSAFDPAGKLNPGKVFPTLHRCAELGKLHVHRGEIPFPDLPRF